MLSAFLLMSCDKSYNAKQVVLDPAEEEWLDNHKNEIYFAPDPFYAPFEFYDDKAGTTRGLAHDYIKLIEKKLGISFNIVKASSFDEILSLAKDRKVSIVNAATKTPERSEYLLFTEPIVEIKNVILVRKDSMSNLSLSELAGKRVSLVQGYAITEFIKKNHPQIKSDIVSSDLNAILNVSYRISDAAVIDLATASYLTEKEGISNIQISGDAGYPIRLAIGSRKDWPQLNSILTKGLAAISQSERDKIYRKWISLHTVSFMESREFKFAAAFMILLFAVSGFVFLWNKQLKKKILIRTLTLRHALDDLRLSEAALRESEARLRNKNEDLIAAVEELDATYEEQVATNEELTSTNQELEKAQMLLKSSLESPAGLIILSVDKNYRYLYFNKTYSDDIKRRYGKEIATGQNALDFIIPEDEREIAKLNIDRAMSGESYTVVRETNDINRLFHEILYNPIYNNNEIVGVSIFVRDITESRLSEERVRTLLAEKELLLSEVHHRIKNNMNTIKGLLTLQISAEENQSAEESLRDAERRVQSMIMLYDRLYCTDNYRELSVKDYLQPLTAEVVGSFPGRIGIQIETDIEDFILNIQILTPLGIIINELLTNIMKHAFIGRDEGVISVTAYKKDKIFTIRVRDNGVGIPESLESEKSKGFGLDLVNMLVDQVGGSVKVERGEGTIIILEFEV